MKQIFNRKMLLLAMLFMGGAVAGFAQNTNDARNALIKAMTGMNPLTQEVKTQPPYGADGWMPVGKDNMLRLNGRYFPTSVYDSESGNSHNVDPTNSYIEEHHIGPELHQPFVVTVQQRRDHGRLVEPVMIHFVAKTANGQTAVSGHIYVQGMRPDRDCTEVGHCATADWSDIYDKYVWIHHRNEQDDIIEGNYSNNVKRNEVFDALVSASACDLDNDGYDEIVVFTSNDMYVFDGKTYAFQKSVDLSQFNGNLATGYEMTEQSYGYKTTKQGCSPNTWTSVVADFDGDGVDDILAICHQDLYWDHINWKSYDYTYIYDEYSGRVTSVFVPGGKGTEFDNLAVNDFGTTPLLNHANGSHIPCWRLNQYNWNYEDGSIDIDIYHYYHVAITAQVVYPYGEYRSSQPVLALAWKYQWSPRQPDKYEEEFRTHIYEWSQITTYNMDDNRTALTSPSGGHPSEAARFDIYDALNSVGAWEDPVTSVGPDLGSLAYRQTVNARGTLRRPVLKTWYAAGRDMAPLLLYEGITVYLTPNGSNQFKVAEVNPLGFQTGFNREYEYNTRICGPIYSYNATDEEGYLTDRELIVVPVAVREKDDDDRWYDKCYDVLWGHFVNFSSADPTVAIVYSNCTSLYENVPAQGQNSPFYYVPYTTNTAKVELTNSYYTASDPMVKAVLAIPPFNTADVANPTGAGVSIGESSESGSEHGGTTSESVGGGFSIDFGLFKAFKFAYGCNFKKNWSKSWGESQKIKQDTEYSSDSRLKDMVLFTYIPVDCFEYTVVNAPQKPSIVGQTFTFRRALNMLHGEAHVMEVFWTVDEYNEIVAPTGAPIIDDRLLGHTVGQRDSYRMVDPFSSKEHIIGEFPVKENGFWAVNKAVNIGSGNVSQKLSIANGHSQGTSETVSQDHKVSFGFGGETEDKVFAGGFGLNASYDSSDSWTTKTSWSQSMSVGGKIPAVKDIQNSYNLYQVWYEYEDEESGQNFLVLDWAVENNSTPTGVGNNGCIGDNAVTAGDAPNSVNLHGLRVNSEYKGIVIKNGKKVVQK